MTEVLLKELTNSDVNWIVANGHRQEVAVGNVLVGEGEVSNNLYILLDGALSVNVSLATKSPLTRAFSAIEGSESFSKEIIRLSSGEVVGEIPFIGSRSTAIIVKAIEKSFVLSIPQQRLAVKVKQDIYFAARFYRAIAILLSERLHYVVTQHGRTNLVQGQPIRDMLCVLGELNDSDIDWMLACGTPKEIRANTTLIREGGPVDALYVLMGGTMSVSISDDGRNPLTRAFAAIEGVETMGREIARLSKGEMVGETPFIDTHLPSTTVKTLEDSFVLSIPRQELAAKLQQDIGFASRFYRAIATLLSHRLQGMLNKFSHGRRVYSRGRSLDEETRYEDELDINDLDSMALAGKRFDWMLGRVMQSLV